MLLGTLNRRTSISDLRQRFAVGRDGMNISDISNVLRHEGAAPHVYRTDARGVAMLGRPAAVYWNENHYVVVAAFGRRVLILDPGAGRSRITYDEFEERFSGVAVTIDGGHDIRTSQLPSPLGILMGHARQSWGLLVTALLLSALTAIVTLAIPGVLDRVFTLLDADAGASAVLLLLGLGLAYALILMVRSLVGLFASVAVGKTMAEAVFDRLLRLPYTYFASRGVGDLLYSLEAVQQLRTLITTDFIVVLVGVVLVASLLIWLGALSLPALLVAAALIIVLLASVLVSNRSAQDASLEEVRQRAALQTIQVSALAGLESIKTNALESAYSESWRAVNGRVQHQFVRLQRIRSAFTSMTAGIQLIGPIIILVATSETAGTTLSAAAIVSVQALSGFLLGQVSLIANSSTQVAQGLALVERVADVLLHEPDTTFSGSKNSLPETSIEVRGVSFSYATFAAPVLKSVSLTIPAHSKVAIVGASGCGKSTLAKLIVGLHKPDSGELFVGGLCLAEYSREGFYSNVAYVPQSIVLEHGSVRDNIAWGAGQLPDAAIVAAAKRVGLHDEIFSLPLGYETPVAQLGQNFSGGQLQRIALARAALKPASIVVLDEATSALDAHSEARVSRYFDEIRATRVVVAHRLSTIVNADLIYVMDRGEIAEYGTHETLMRQERGLYRQLYAHSVDEERDQSLDEIPPTELLVARSLAGGEADD